METMAAQTSLPVAPATGLEKDVAGTARHSGGSKTKKGAQKGPSANLSDIPEQMPGANCRANPAQREAFERRSRQLHRDEVDEENERQEHANAAAGATMTVADLEAMFPLLDADLIRSLCADVPSPQNVIETLLALNGAMSEPAAGTARARTPPPRDLVVEDHQNFPTLVDAAGWQVATQRDFERDPDEDLGNVWAVRARVAADKPAPLTAKSAWGTTLAASRNKKDTVRTSEDAPEQAFPLTDYESRQKVGMLRAKQQMQYGRGSKRRAKGGGQGRSGYQHERSGDSDLEEDELYDEPVGALDEDA